MRYALFALAFFALSACGGGGGGGAGSTLPPSAGPVSAGTAAPASTSTAAPARSASSTIAFLATDYFTGAAINATLTVDSVSAAMNGGTAVITATAGLHTVQITANGHATYNGGLQTPSAYASRTIRLFPVTALMTTWLAQINSDRASNGASTPVQLDDMLTIAAYDHAMDMAAQGYFAHFDPQGYAPTTRSLMLGSMMMGAENIAAGYQTWTGAENAFMAEKSTLPSQSPADCPSASEAAGHYCNIVWPSHNWVGLAAVAQGGSEYGRYYDQEFGDLYGVYDAFPLLSPATGASFTVDLAVVNGASFTSAATTSLQAPQPISIATLNADPTCASQCPVADQWYPTASSAGHSQQVALNVTQSKPYFVAQYTSAHPYVGAGSWAIAYPNPAATPAAYADASKIIAAQMTRTESGPDTGYLVPNPGPMGPVSRSSASVKMSPY